MGRNISSFCWTMWPQTFISRAPVPGHQQLSNILAVAQGLADSAPGQAISVLRGPLTEALKDVQQDQDRPRTFAAAEAISGLLASSSSYAGRPAVTP